MTKKDFIRKIYNKQGCTWKEAEGFVDNFIQLVSEVVIDGDSIVFQNFGKFSPVLVKEHKGVNPKTGESIMIPEKRRFSFKPASALKNMMND